MSVVGTLARGSSWRWRSPLARMRSARLRRGRGAPCEITTRERVVAAGKVHGGYESFVAILRHAQIVLNWQEELKVRVSARDRFTTNGPNHAT